MLDHVNHRALKSNNTTLSLNFEVEYLWDYWVNGLTTNYFNSIALILETPLTSPAILF